MKRILSAFFYSALFFVLAPGGDCSSLPPEPISVTVSILPLANLVERIGGERVRVLTLVPPGQNPHVFEPSPRQLVQAGQSRILFHIGLSFEKQIVQRLAKASADLRVVDLSRRKPEGSGEHGQAHHEHGPQDPHIWLSPPLIPSQLRLIEKALTEADPSGEASYHERLVKSEEIFAKLDREIGDLLAPFKGRSFYVFHPAFGRFAETYGLKEIAIELEGKSPTPRRVAGVIEEARRLGVRTLFVQPQFDRKSAAVIARALEAELVVLDPLGPDLAANLREMASKIRVALEKQKIGNTEEKP
ncbi:zinc ABC transporter substrate-binding protein [bacterium]|nr:zinc ABC transporter substrate-binding protein [bacterium]